VWWERQIIEIFEDYMIITEGFRNSTFEHCNRRPMMHLMHLLSIAFLIMLFIFWDKNPLATFFLFLLGAYLAR
jgi:hypothetical protein